MKIHFSSRRGAVILRSKSKKSIMDMKQDCKTRQVSDLLLILWAGGAALLSYSLVYALRKPYTAAAFDGLTFFGSDYKVAVTTIQILGYVISKFFGIKIISELKKENRFRFLSAWLCLPRCR